MCGIFCSIVSTNGEKKVSKIVDNCRPLLQNRGPDATSERGTVINDFFEALFLGCVLWTQGASVTPQPLCNASGQSLLWNGDVYHGLDLGDESDTEAVFKALCDGPLEMLCRISGPYSFIFWDGEKLWLGRDPLGKHSLLWHLCEDQLIVSSVCSRHDPLIEVPAVGIFCVEFTDKLSVELLPWSHVEAEKLSGFSLGPPIKHDIISRLNITNEPLQPTPDVSHLVKVFSDCAEPAGCLKTILYEDSWRERTDTLLRLLRQSVALRVTKLPQYCKNCIAAKSSCHHPKVGILFSGGLDSTVLAVIADEFVPRGEPIELYNVAFERRRDEGFDVPDRLTGRSSLKELQSLAPHRKWNFIEIDVTREELASERDCSIADVIHPLGSVLDDSLGCALWFAARGRGNLLRSPYTPSARVVLLGSGADEMLGGYRRARAAWRDGGWTAVRLSLQRSLADIPLRNLARDNRVVSSHGLVPRLPFLHEPLVAFLATLPPHHRCYLGREAREGVGDKLLLRLAAVSLGLCRAAVLPKRALQFGSRIADPKEKGHLPSSRLATHNP